MGQPTSSQTAHTLLRQAHHRAYRLPQDFGGFRAHLEFAEGAQPLAKGSVTIRSPRDITLTMNLAEQQQTWVSQQIASLIGHRWHAPYDAGDGRYTLTLKDDKDHVQGQEIRFLDDPFTSAYRLRDGGITSVERQFDKQRFTITIQQTQLLDTGQTLPQAFTVTFWDNASSRLVRTEIYQDAYSVVDGYYLPAERRIVTAEDGGLIARTIRFTDHTLLAAADTSNEENIVNH